MSTMGAQRKLRHAQDRISGRLSCEDQLNSLQSLTTSWAANLSPLDAACLPTPCTLSERVRPGGRVRSVLFFDDGVVAFIPGTCGPDSTTWFVQQLDPGAPSRRMNPGRGRSCLATSGATSKGVSIPNVVYRLPDVIISVSLSHSGQRSLANLIRQRQKPGVAFAGFVRCGSRWRRAC